MVFFIIGFFIVFILNIGYLVILFFNQKHGGKVNLALYGWTMIADFYRFKENLLKTENGRWFGIVVGAFVVGIVLSAVLMWYGILLENSYWK